MYRIAPMPRVAVPGPGAARAPTRSAALIAAATLLLAAVRPLPFAAGPSSAVGAEPPAGALDGAPPPARSAPGTVRPASNLAQTAARREIPTGCRRGGPPFRINGPRDKRVVALTFDDGPSDYTDDVIRILVREKAKGTFFVLGNQIPGRERLLQRMLGWGFEIGDHSYSHPQFPSSAQLSITRDRIRKASGFTPCLFRPPYGAVNRDLIGRARALGMMTINWDVDPRDWSTPGSGAIYSRIVGAAQPGSIILGMRSASALIGTGWSAGAAASHTYRVDGHARSPGRASAGSVATQLTAFRPSRACGAGRRALLQPSPDRSQSVIPPPSNAVQPTSAAPARLSR